MSANLVPTDATLCHYGSGKGYIPGISVAQTNFSDSIPPPALMTGNVITMTNSAVLTDSTDQTVVNSNKRFRAFEIYSTNTSIASDPYNTSRLIIEQRVSDNTNVNSVVGQGGTNRNYSQISASNQGGVNPIDLIVNSNYIKLGSSVDTYVGSGTNQEHVLVATNPSRNNANALAIRGPLLVAPSSSIQGDPYFRISPSIPVSGSTPLGTIRELQLNDPLQAGPFALPLSYLSASNTVCIRTNGLTNNRTLPLSEVGVSISTTAATTGNTFSIAGASFTTGVGAGSYGITSGSVTLPNDSLGKTYVFDACIPCTIAATTVAGAHVLLRVGAVEIGRTVLGKIDIAADSEAVNISIRSFYTSVANSEAVTLFNNSGVTITPAALGKLMIREVPRTVA